MSHGTTDRRTLINPEASPSLHPVETNRHHHHKHRHHQHHRMEPATTVIKSLTLDPARPSQLSSHFSRLDLKNRQRIPGPTKDIHLQAKAMTRSADADSFTKPRWHMPQISDFYKEGKVLKKVSLEKGPKRDLGSTSLKKEELAGEKMKQHSHLAMKRGEAKGQSEKDVEAKSVSVSLVDRRRSLCGSKEELGNTLANCGVKIVSVDMPPFMQIHAVDLARKTHDSLEKFSAKTLALNLKKEFDGVYGPAWHCIVGTSFGSFVTHSVGGFLYFSMDQKLYILLFKTSVQKLIES